MEARSIAGNLRNPPPFQGGFWSGITYRECQILTCPGYTSSHTEHNFARVPFHRSCACLFRVRK